MRGIQEHPEVSTLIGTPQEIKSRLVKSRADKVLVFSVEHADSEAEVKTLFDNLSTVAFSMLEVIKQDRDKQVLKDIVDALLPRTPATPTLLREASMLAQARKAVLDSGDWLTAAEIAQVAGFSTTNPSAQPNKWKKQKQIFAINHRGIDYYPGYALDKETNFRPLKVTLKIIEVFEGHKDAWGMAFWFMSVNSFLGGMRPQDLLATVPNRVIEAAQDEILGVSHG